MTDLPGVFSIRIPRFLLAPKRFALTLASLVTFLFLIVPATFWNRPYWLNVLTNASILSFASLGVWITFSIGRVNLAQAAFAMIGGYTTALLSVYAGVSFWICVPLAAAVSTLVAVLIGWPLLRLKGIYFAMVTLSLTEAVRLGFLSFTTTTGIGGITNVPVPSGLSGALSLYFFCATLLVVGFIAVWRLSASRLGWIFRSMRQSEDLAMSIGIDIARYRVLAFGICSAMGGVAGACFLILQQNIFPVTYQVSDSIDFLLYCFLGGLNYILGPIVGAFGLTLAFELLRGIQQYQALLYGVLMIAVMMFLPNGILSLVFRRGDSR
jgi:branched-chain amino acid transport system permease protein